MVSNWLKKVMKEKIWKKLVLICVGLYLLFLGLKQAEAAITNKQNIFSTEEPTWISKAGLSKGQNHDR